MRTPLALCLLCAALLLAACGSGSKPAPTATASPALTSPATQEPTTTPSPPVASEAGEAPIYWRTADAFSSLVAGTPYKVIFRVTSGYAEPTLAIAARADATGATVEFAAEQVQASAGEAPGSYYAINIRLPAAGAWELTVVAGEDEASIPVFVVDAIATPF